MRGADTPYAGDRAAAPRAVSEAASAALWHSVVDTAVDAIIVTDDHGTVLAYNPGAERMFGYSAEEIIGSSVQLLMPEPYHSQSEAALERYLREGIHRIIGSGREASGRHKDGSTIPIDLAVSEATIGGRRLFTGIARDVTERHQAQAHRRTIEAQLEQAQRLEMVGRLAGGLAHDFNNLLMVIQTTAGLVRQAVEDPSLHADLAQIDEAVERGSSLTRQLLTFARQQVVQSQVLSLDEVVSDIEPLLQRTLGDDIVLAVEPSTTWPVKADRGRLQQALLNLVVNARDAMPEGGRITISTHNALLDDEFLAASPDALPGAYVSLVVSDNGTGMTPDVLSRAFEPFFTTKQAHRGTGLGLGSVYGTVTGAGGTVRIDSEPGRGTTVRAYLPAVAQEVETEPPSPEPPAVGKLTGTVLLVEDSAPVRQLTARLMTEAGLNVAQAAGGEQAVALAADMESIDLLVTDVVMPGMSGRELARRVAAHHPGTPALFMSGYSAGSLERPGMLEPGTRLLEKPFSRTELLGRVAEAMAART